MPRPDTYLVADVIRECDLSFSVAHAAAVA
jgi:hypothetical protein